jgi:transcriptional regulator
VYLPKAFAEADLAALDALAAAHPFATLVTIADGAPFVSHVPVLYRSDGSGIELRGHWARANPQWKHGGIATIVLHGPSAYVSPAWYPDKETAARVPTWNYAVAHLAGTLEILQDEADLAAIVDNLSKRFEGAIAAADPAHVPWPFEFEREDQRVQLRGIVGFRLRPAKVDLKFKLNQNHPVANRVAVATQLARGDATQREVAAMMQGNLARAASGTDEGRRTLSPAPLPVGEGTSKS